MSGNSGYEYDLFVKIISKMFKYLARYIFLLQLNVPVNCIYVFTYLISQM